MFKKPLIYLSVTMLLFSACKKSDPLTGPADKSLAYVSFTNANPTRPLNLYIDGTKISNVSFIGLNSTLAGTYTGVQPGTRTLLFRDTITASNVDYLTTSITVSGGNSYSYYVYDQVTGGQLKGILLNTDRTPDANTANSKVRFLNLSPGSPALDFWVVRREAAVAKDSIMLYAAVPYLGSVTAPDIASLSTFKPVLSSMLAGALSPTSPASDYIFRVKLTGTNTIISSVTGFNLINSKNYTIFARGIYPALGLTVTLNN